MNSLRHYLYGEVKEEVQVKYPATKKFIDENGRPLEWVLKVLSKDEIENIYNQSMKKLTVEGEDGHLGYIFDSNAYLLKLVTKSVQFPNLKDLELQSSYDVDNEEDLLKKLVDSPVEYRRFCSFVEELNSDDKSFEEELDEIKELINSDLDACYAHYCLHKLKMLPSQFLNLPREERMFIIASIHLKVEQEKEEYEKMKH